MENSSASPKRKRLTPSPGPPSSGSSVSGGDSDTEKPLSAFYQSLLESSYAADGNDHLKPPFKLELNRFIFFQVSSN